MYSKDDSPAYKAFLDALLDGLVKVTLPDGSVWWIRKPPVDFPAR